MSRFSGRSNLSAAPQGTRQTLLLPVVPKDASVGQEPSFLQEGAGGSAGAETLQAFTQRLQQMIRLTGVAIALQQNGTPDNPVVCVASSGPAAPPRGTILERSRGISAECFETRETKVSNDTLSDARVNREVCRRNNVRSTVVVPLLLDGEPIGILGVFSDQPGYFSERQVFLLEFIASFVSHASAIAPIEPEPPAAILNSPSLAPEDTTQAATSVAGWRTASSQRFLLSIAAAVVVLAILSALFLSRSGAKDANSASTGAAAGADAEASRSHSTSAAPAGPVLGTGASIAGSVEHWSTPGYSRITIRLDQQRQANCARVSDPERLYCDFAGLTFPAGYTGEDFPGDPLVAGLRVGQYRPGTARVVFDLKVPSARHAIAVLSNPPRFMVEIMDLSRMGVQESSTAGSTPSTASAPNPLPEGADLQVPAASRLTIVIDPGHGGRDTGTIGPDGLKEKDLALDVARRLGDLLRSRLGARVVFTRSSDRFISLEARSEIANRARASLFVSIHGNGSDYAPAKGIETYYLGESVSSKDADVARAENEILGDSTSTPHLQLAAQRAPGSAAGKRMKQSRQLAVDVQESLYQAAAQAGGTRDRGVRTAPFLVLKDANMPAILAEISFVSSKSEEHKLMQPAHREALAVGLFEGIAAHLARGEEGKAPTVDSAALP